MVWRSYRRIALYYNKTPPFTQDFPVEGNQCDENVVPVHVNRSDIGRAVSSAEEQVLHTHLVGGSNPSLPTKTYLLVPLTRGMVAKIDAEDALLVSRYAWSANETMEGRFYAQAKDEQGKNVYLHRLILNAPSDLLADHRNHDTLDCRRFNLRLATTVQNTANCNRKRSHSGFRGVTLRKTRFQAKIMRSGKFYHLGYFATGEEAAVAYDKAAIEHFGEFAVLNFPSS